MINVALENDVVAYFWNAYFEWRASHALNDTCMLELVAAIRAEINSGELCGVEVVCLKKLARMIEMQLIAVAADCRAA
jgi:hypothetical protein